PSAAAEPALASPAGPAAAPAVLAAAPRLGVTHPLAIDRPMEHGDYVWNDKGVPAGPVWIVVDIEGQMLYAYRGGYEIGRAVILYGADDKPTPYGDFTVTQKRVDHVSNLYDAPMPYMMRLTDDGVAIHGSTVEYGSATHGCIGVPLEFAELLFAAARLGTPVALLDGWENEPGRAQPRA
ncbi:MAG: L,D-transpeptidase family protein, partial [Sphingomonadaceae bacterium]